MADGLTIRPAVTAADLAAVRGLCWAYRDFLLAFGETERLITETFYPEEKYTALMGRLEQVHARPRGIILLAERDGAVVGCGMSHPLSETEAEIKRVYVTDAARGTGAGRRLCEALIHQARADGYARLFLDTSKSLAPARALYAALGFLQRGPYQPIPEIARDAVVFYELDLRTARP